VVPMSVPRTTIAAPALRAMEEALTCPVLPIVNMSPGLPVAPACSTTAPLVALAITVPLTVNGLCVVREIFPNPACVVTVAAVSTVMAP